METIPKDKQVVTKISKTVDNAKKLRALLRRDKELARKLHEMNKFEFDDFILDYNDDEKKFLKYLRRAEQIRINVKSWRERMVKEIGDLEKSKEQLLSEKNALEVEIEKLKKHLNLE